MQIKLLALFIFLCFICGVSFIHRDQPGVPRIIKALNTFYQTYPQEKVFLIIDRENYDPGEIAWLKGYITFQGKPSVISKVLYVELIDSTGIIVNREILPVEAGAAEGSLNIPLIFSAGRYRVRGYTSWMMNFDAAFYFEKQITITTGSKGKAGPLMNPPKEYKLEYFPEGGSLVLGLTSKVAFKAFGSDGLPVEVKGKITDSSGKVIKQFSTLHDGMGSFAIHPMPGNIYNALVDFPGGISKRFLLPEAKRSGIILYVNSFLAENGDDSLYFRISRSVTDKERYQHLVICAQMEAKTSFTYINFDDSTAGNYNNSILSAPTELALNGFPAGLLHLTIFNDSDEILAERLLLLHRRQEQLHPTLSASALNFTPGGKNVFKLEVPGDLKGNYTVTVTNGDLVSGMVQADNIFSNLLLASDLKRKPLDWAWYFRDTLAETLQAMDLLMLTTRWTRFDWKKILNNEFPKVRYYAEQSLTLKGQAFSGIGKDKKPLKEKGFSLMIKAPRDSLLDIMNVPVDGDGRFTLTNLNFHDSATMYVQNNNKKKGKDISVEFEKNPMDSIFFAATERIPDLRERGSDYYRQKNSSVILRKTGQVMESGSSKNQDTAILKPVTVKGYLKTRIDSVVQNYASPGIFARTGSMIRSFDCTDDSTAKSFFGINVIEFLQNKVPGLIISYNTDVGEYLIYWRMANGLFTTGSEIDRIKMNAPAFFLDEGPLNEGNVGYDEAVTMLQDIKMEDVALVRIFEPGTMSLVSGNASHGAIVIYLKNGSEGGLAHLPKAGDKIKKAGYAVLQKFSSPDYENGQKKSTLDERKTLYWNPDLKTDSATHTALFTFYNDDITRRFHVIVEGMDCNGKLVCMDKLFEK